MKNLKNRSKNWQKRPKELKKGYSPLIPLYLDSVLGQYCWSVKVIVWKCGSREFWIMPQACTKIWPQGAKIINVYCNAVTALKIKVFSERASSMRDSIRSVLKNTFRLYIDFLGIWGHVNSYAPLIFSSFARFVIKLTVWINSNGKVTWPEGLLYTGSCGQSIGRQHNPFSWWFWHSPSWHLRDG